MKYVLEFHLPLHKYSELQSKLSYVILIISQLKLLLVSYLFIISWSRINDKCFAKHKSLFLDGSERYDIFV